MSHYTLVRHSAYAVSADPRFEDAVELCELTAHQTYMVRAAGGLVFTTSEAAHAAAMEHNFPDGPTPAPPNVPGHFSSLRIRGAEIYVPPTAPPDDASGLVPAYPTT